MLGLVFPGVVTEALQSEFKAFAPAFRSGDRPERLPPYTHQQVLDNLLQMNVAEIRTMVNQLLVRPVVLTYCPPQSRGQLTRMLDRLMWDETRHVGYTAQLMEQALASQDAEFIRDTIPLRFTQFNEMTLGEVGRAPADPDPAYT
jgi:hypothetical protein